MAIAHLFLSFPLFAVALLVRLEEVLSGLELEVDLARLLWGREWSVDFLRRGLLLARTNWFQAGGFPCLVLLLESVVLPCCLLRRLEMVSAELG